MTIRSIPGKPGAAIAEEIALLRRVIASHQSFVDSNTMPAELKEGAAAQLALWRSILGRLEVLERAGRGGPSEP